MYPESLLLRILFNGLDLTNKRGAGQKNPEVFSNCFKYIVKDIVSSFHEDNAMEMLIKIHSIIGRYFKPFVKQVRSP